MSVAVPSRMRVSRSCLGVALASLSGLALGACTLFSPTNITASQDPALTDDGGGSSTASSLPASGSSGSSGPAASGASSATCGTTDFTKPDLSTLTACGNGGGHCYAKTKVDSASEFTACADATQVCVPDEILLADGSPLKSCTSIIGAGGCVNATLIPAIAAQGGGALKQDVCAAGLTCVPCTDPTHNNAPTPFCQPIGVHTNDCAAGSGAAADAGPPPQACCTTNGKSNGVCLSSSAIPANQQKNTVQDTCPAADKCVPAAFVDGKPVKCPGDLLGAGVCLDKCFNSLLGTLGGAVLNNNGCGTTELCIPCSLVSGQGVPGCP